MHLRYNKGCSPQITFTSDYHELVHGDLIPGPCLLRYDPLRVVCLEAAACAAHQIRGHVRFHPGGVEWQGLMHLPAGLPLADLADSTGRGFMLSTTFDIPEDCDELEIWFSCTHVDGHTEWDSNFGKNFWLRFGLADLHIQSAVVSAARDPLAAKDTFTLACRTKANVEAMNVRWRVTNAPTLPRVTTPLVISSTTQAGRIWSSPEGSIPVPKGATVAFDLVYKVGGRDFTDDNQGRWYIAD